MKYTPIDPPRRFHVGLHEPVELRDCGRLEADADEQVTFVTSAGGEYDVVRKSWGFYATPSLNHRLPRFGLRAALVKNRAGHVFVVLVERGREREFQAYREGEELEVMSWLDSDEAVRRLETGRCRT